MYWECHRLHCNKEIRWQKKESDKWGKLKKSNQIYLVIMDYWMYGVFWRGGAWWNVCSKGKNCNCYKIRTCKCLGVWRNVSKIHFEDLEDNLISMCGNLLHSTIRLTGDIGLHVNKILLSWVLLLNKTKNIIIWFYSPFQMMSYITDAPAKGAKRGIVMEPSLMSHFSCYGAIK